MIRENKADRDAKLSSGPNYDFARDGGRRLFSLLFSFKLLLTPHKMSLSPLLSCPALASLPFARTEPASTRRELPCSRYIEPCRPVRFRSDGRAGGPSGSQKKNNKSNYHNLRTNRPIDSACGGGRLVERPAPARSSLLAQ